MEVGDDAVDDAPVESGCYHDGCRCCQDFDAVAFKPAAECLQGLECVELCKLLLVGVPLVDVHLLGFDVGCLHDECYNK